MLGVIGLVGGLVILTILVMRGVNLLIAAPLSALFVGVLNGIPLFSQLATGKEMDLLQVIWMGFLVL